jgi:3-oxoacyl-[acyl-carrier protein] reductase
MMKERWGRIINLTSIVGIGGQAGQANYSAAKAGLIGLTKSVAKEFGSRGITCNAIAPGFIETDMTSTLPDEMRDKITSTAAAGRLGRPEDIAATAAFLASEGASYITGQVLVVDGGLTL